LSKPDLACIVLAATLTNEQKDDILNLGVCAHQLRNSLVARGFLHLHLRLHLRLRLSSSECSNDQTMNFASIKAIECRPHSLDSPTVRHFIGSGSQCRTGTHNVHFEIQKSSLKSAQPAACNVGWHWTLYSQLSDVVLAYFGLIWSVLVDFALGQFRYIMRPK
jgi:hypothetical protein